MPALTADKRHANRRQGADDEPRVTVSIEMIVQFVSVKLKSTMF